MKFIVYTSFNKDPIISRIYTLRQEQDKEVFNSLYCETLSLLLEKAYELDLKHNLLKMYLCYLMASDENIFSLTAEKKGRDMDEKLFELVCRDVAGIIDLWECTMIQEELSPWDSPHYLMDIYKALDKKADTSHICEYLADYYKRRGAGVMNRFRAFKWDQEQGLIGIAHCDPVRLEDLVECDYQKQVLIQNTESFLRGKAANNALLFGDSGTGKSSCVKALLNRYDEEGLRIVELSKTDFMFFNKILANLRGRGTKFIIFLDDLSFEEFETEYKQMKALIEGGIEAKPDNVLIYATSNRRHLIRETWQERQGEDVHIRSTQQEKLSLADRFGLALTFTSPSQNAYLKIVSALAKKYKIDVSDQLLREKAIQWELAHGGRSGRAAQQFIQSLM